MFGRGNWAILGLAKESLETFKASLEDRTMMVAVSQMAALAYTRFFSSDGLGINPYGAPRLDEQHPLGSEHQEQLATYVTLEQQARAEYEIAPQILESEGYGLTVQQFQVHPNMPWYGLWAVSNEWKDVGDVASVKEQRSYVMMERPYKFLQSIDKKAVDQDAAGVTASVRKQVPVLLDFNDGRVFIESTNKKLIQEIITRLKQMGADTFPVAWTYKIPNWTSAVLNKLYEATQYQGDFRKRADEATRFRPNEIEKLEDRELESIVANYFSMTQLPSDLWVGISGPAQIRLHDASPPIGVKAATTGTTLLDMTNEARVVSGAITFQERITTTTKVGGERTFRKDLLSIDVNDRINLSDVGAAMLRGFDLPSLRKDIQREIRKTNQVPSIEQFWGGWLHALSNAVRTIEGTFRELLDIDGDQEAGILPVRIPTVEETPELVNS